MNKKELLKKKKALLVALALAMSMNSGCVKNNNDEETYASQRVYYYNVYEDVDKDGKYDLVDSIESTIALPAYDESNTHFYELDHYESENRKIKK